MATTINVRWSYDDLARQFRKAAVGLLLFCGVASVAHCGSGCIPLRPAGEAEAEYTARILACARSARTKAESATCRRQVNMEFGLCERADWPRITPCDEE